MTERRYDDEEIAEILANATSEDVVSAADGGNPARSGLTLGELQAIGADVGIDPARIAEATRALERRGSAPAPRTFLGTRRSVARMVPLERPLDDDEWDRLVADLRATFGAVGESTGHGSLRTWRNGNLQAHVEPHGDGWRLRMQTLKGDAPALAGLGATFAGVGALLMVLATIGGVDVRDLVIGLIFTLVGLGQLGFVRLSLPAWASEREAQMDAIAERLPNLLKP